MLNKLNLIGFAEIITNCVVWYDFSDDLEDFEKFKIICEWFEEYQNLEFNSKDELFKHFLNLQYEDEE